MVGTIKTTSGCLGFFLLSSVKLSPSGSYYLQKSFSVIKTYKSVSITCFLLVNIECTTITYCYLSSMGVVRFTFQSDSQLMEEIETNMQKGIIVVMFTQYTPL